MPGLGERLLQIRKRLALTQKQIAGHLGVGLRTYVSAEAGEAPLETGAVAKLAAFGVNLSWLLTGNGEELAQASSTPSRSHTDRELMARIMDGLVVLYREENQRLVPLDQGRMSAEIYDSLVGIADEAEQRGGLRALLEQRRQEMRRAAIDPASSKRQA